MRLASLLRYRHRLPMQVNRGTKLLSSSKATSPSSTSQDKPDSQLGIKRPYSAQARVQSTSPSPPPSLIPTLPLPSPAKFPRAMDNTFSSARRGFIPSPRGRGKNHSRKGVVSSDGGGLSPFHQQQSRQAGSIRPSSPSKRGRRGNATRSVYCSMPSIEGPFHDEAFIVKEYFKSGTDLRGDYKRNPKSPLHNFYSVAKNGQHPKYETVQGTYMKGSERIQIWRCAAEFSSKNYVSTGIDNR